MSKPKLGRICSKVSYHVQQRLMVPAVPGSKADSAFQPSKVSQMITKCPGDLLAKSKLFSLNGSTASRKLNFIREKGPQRFF